MAAVAGALLSSILVTNAAAASWSEVDVSTNDDGTESIDGIGWPSGLVTLSPSTAIALYELQTVDAGIYIKRSTNGGLTWAEPIRLSEVEVSEWGDGPPPDARAAIAGSGSAVDIVWIEDWHDHAVSHVQYKRSANAGASLTPAVTIADPAHGHPTEVAIARNAADLVAFAYIHKRGGVHSLRVKVSKNDGVTFETRATLARGSLIADVKIAVGNGVIYVAYMERGNDNKIRLRIRRSLDAGSTWANPVTVGGPPVMCCGFRGSPSIIANASRAWVGYTAVVDGVTRARYRTSGNKGSTWSAPVDLSRRRSAAPVLAFVAGDLHAAYLRCFEDGCTGSATILYKHKPAGGAWSAAEETGGCCYAISLAAIGWAQRPIVLWMLEPDGSCCYKLGTIASIRSP